MIGWIVSNHLSGKDISGGDILGSDGLLYSFHSSEQKEEYNDLAQETCVSYSVPDSNDTESCAVIEGVLPEMQDEVTTRIKTELRTMLSPARYMHVFRVSKIACALAERYGGSPEKAEIAGILHDAAKENPAEENLRIVHEAGLKMAAFEMREHSILHAAAGSVLASLHFGINDPEILNAIRYHNGRPAMQKLEKIVFLADHIDYVYKNGLQLSRAVAAEKDLDRAIFKMFTEVNREIVKAGKRADPITESTMNYMFVNLNGLETSENVGEDSDTPITDELFDRILEINSRRGLMLNSVKNIRELGGCNAYDGRRVRRGMLVRSGRLKEMTDEDAERLADLGVGTIIDLRSDDEIANAPDKNTRHFRQEHCPLPTVELTEYQRNIQEKYFLTPPGDEKAYYLSEYLSCISMKEMYMNVLTEESSVSSLRRIFDILCEPGHGGYLFHCTSGKDRTGIVAALLLLALGTPMEEIREDYYTSALATFSETEAFAQKLRRKHYSAAFIDEMRYYNGIGMSIAETVYEEIVSRYGSAEKYLKDVLLSEEKILLLRNKYTEP